MDIIKLSSKNINTEIYMKRLMEYSRRRKLKELEIRKEIYKFNVNRHQGWTKKHTLIQFAKSKQSISLVETGYNVLIGVASEANIHLQKYRMALK